MQRGGQFAQALAVARFLHERNQLLDEERVAAAAFEEKGDGVFVGVAQQRAYEFGGGLLVERFEMQRQCVVAPDARGPVRLEAGARCGDEHEAAVVQTLEQAVAEFEDLFTCPVHVGDREHDRCGRAQPFQERDHRAQRVVARASGIDARTRHPFDHVDEAFDDALDLGRFLRQVEQARHPARGRGVHRRVANVAVESGMFAQRFRDRAVHVGVAVRKALAAHDERVVIGGGAVRRFGCEAALSNTGVARK